MVVRLMAVMLALGMLVIAVQPLGDLAPASSDVAAYIDGADELPVVEVVEPAMVALVEARTILVPPLDAPPIAHAYDSSVFRPPRAAAFA